MVKKEKTKNITMNMTANREVLSHKGLRRPIAAVQKNSGDDLIIGRVKISN